MSVRGIVSGLAIIAAVLVVLALAWALAPDVALRLSRMPS